VRRNSRSLGGLNLAADFGSAERVAQSHFVQCLFGYAPFDVRACRMPLVYPRSGRIKRAARLLRAWTWLVRLGATHRCEFEVCLTLRRRGTDSKFQFRDASPPPTAWAPSFSAGERRLLEPQNSSIGLPRPTTARVIPPRRLSIGPNSTEASKPLAIWRGTEISNPVLSSGESANRRFRDGGRWFSGEALRGSAGGDCSASYLPELKASCAHQVSIFIPIRFLSCAA
jgi:hypothetical protein